MKISAFKRISKAYLTVGATFGTWYSPIITGVFITILRLIVGAGRILDRIFFPHAINKKLENPIMIVGNPRSGTTFLHRYLVKNGIGVMPAFEGMLSSEEIEAVAHYVSIAANN